jgi:hypothetical protein
VFNCTPCHTHVTDTKYIAQIKEVGSSVLDAPGVRDVTQLVSQNLSPETE